MDMHALRYFQAVARASSITHAARALRVGQSTLSEAMRRLEEDLGTPLFLRGRSGVRLTEAGEVLLERSDAVLGLLDQTRHEIRDLRSEACGKLVLGCHDSLGSYFLPELLRSFLAEHDRIDLEVRNHGSDAIRELVIAREVHVGLVVNPRPHPDLVMVDAFTDVVTPMALARASSLDAASRILACSTLVVPSRAPFDALAARMRDSGFRPARTMVTGDLGLARSLAVSGIGPALLPWRVATDGAPLVPLHPDLPCHEDRVMLVWRGDLPRTKAAARLREALVAHARALPAADAWRAAIAV